MSERRFGWHKKRVKHHLVKGWVIFAALIVTIAIIFSVFRALTPWARQYKPMVEQHLSTMLGQPVVIKNMETSWYWFHPVLRLDQVSLVDSHDHTLKLNKLLIGVDLLSSLWNWKIQPGILYIDQTQLVLHQLSNRWTLNGLDLTHDDSSLGAEAYLFLLGGLSSHEKIVVRNVTTVIYLRDGSIIPLKQVNLTIQNRSGHYLLKGTAELNRASKTVFSIVADFQLNSFELNKVKGQIYISIKSLLPTQWQDLLPHLPVKIRDGQGDITVWLNIDKGRLTQGQGQLSFRHLKINRAKDVKSLYIESIDGDFGWKRTQTGWLLNGDHLKLIMNGTKWPENGFQIQHDKVQQSYQLFVKHILLEPLLAVDIPWPDRLKPLLAMKPTGQLNDTSFHFKGQSPEYLLTAFSDLSWEEKGNIPAVSGLTGVLNWQPGKGRLELDSHQTVIEPHHIPPLSFSQINMALEWAPLKQGTQVNLKHFVLQNQNLTLTANGAIDDLENYPNSQVRFVTQFSTAHGEEWIKYIPAHLLKAKLDQWLKNNIKLITKAKGQIKLDGNMADFPFDNTPGTFSILTFLNGVDLLIGPHWPLSREVDAYLRVDKRNMDVDIQHANLNGILVNNMSLRMDDIGLDYEQLLLHGKIYAPAETLLAYVLKTPLKEKLSRLKALDLSGLLGLDIKVEVPLYPENDDILTQGEIKLENNQALFKLGSVDLSFDNLIGQINFNEKGVSDGALTAMLTGLPVNMHIQSIEKPKHALQITLNGDTSIDALSQMFHFPILALMKGPLNLDAVLTLTDAANDMDSLQINSSLKNVVIALPKPLGKALDIEAPLKANIDFDKNKAIRVRVQYATRLSTDLWYKMTQKHLALSRGEIRVGYSDATAPKEKGLKISGTLPAFDKKQWAAVMSKLPFDKSSPSIMDMIRWVDVHFESLNIFHHKVTDVAVKATQLEGHEWSVQIKQKDLTAYVRYQPIKHLLSGQIERIHVDNSPEASKFLLRETEQLSPTDIPNLHLTVQHLLYGDIDLGQVDIDSVSTPTNMQLDGCKISSPFYNLTIKGNWLKDKAVNRTDIRADLNITKLGKSLERWHYKPVVEANKGAVYFVGGWPGGFTDFSLEKVSGQMQLQFKDGRITDLGSATEGKIGFGKLLSIFSLQTIPRRLTLDFSDLSHNGYSFDEFKGDFQLKKGVMSTLNSSMDGPVAYVSMKGDVDVLKHQFFLDLYVSPHVMASLPVVATIAGGPIVGIATWAASKIINQGIIRVTGYSYKVSGPWSDPRVEQVRIDKKRVKQSI